MARLIKIAEWSGTKRGNVVFIHGLGGHPYDTWRRTGVRDTFWPQWLAEDIPGLDVFSLGYHAPPSNWFGTAMPLQDEAIHCLRVLISDKDLKSGPIAIVCHSLGGLMAKSMLRLANEQQSDLAIADFFSCVQRVVFIATPHTGAGKASMLEWLSWLAWPSNSTRALVANNPHLRDLNFAYRNLAESRKATLRHLVYYEMQDTAFGRIVSPASADPGLPGITPTPIPADHVTIAKPLRRDELLYLETKGFLTVLGPVPETKGALRLQPEEVFATERNWQHWVPKATRVAALLLVFLSLWKGAPLVVETLQAILKIGAATEGILAEQKKLSIQLARIEAMSAGREVKPEEIEQTAEAILPVIQDLDSAADDRSIRASEALQRKDVLVAEKILSEIFVENTLEGKAANREAANAARNIAAFKRLTDVRAATALYRKASELDPENFNNWIDLGSMSISMGSVADAKQAFAQAKTIAEKLVQGDPGNVQWKRDLSVSQSRIGDVLSIEGNLQGALISYRASLAIAEKLNRDDPDNVKLRGDLSISLEKIGNVLSSQGKLPDALLYYRAGLTIAEKLAQAEPGNTKWQRDLVALQIRVGHVLSTQGNLPEALASFQAGLIVAKKMAQGDRSNTEWQRNLSVSQIKIGDVLTAQDKLPEALLAYRASLTIAEKLALGDTGNPDWQRDMSISRNNIGNVLRAQGKLSDALVSYRAGLAIAEKLAHDKHDNTEWQRDLSISWNKVGEVLRAQGKLHDALLSYRAGLVIREKLVLADNSNVQWMHDLALNLGRVADVLDLLDNRSEAKVQFRRARQIIADLLERSPDMAELKFDLRSYDSRLKELGG